MKHLIAVLISVFLVSSCATIVNDPMVPVTFTFSDGSDGECHLTNKRGVWETDLPATVYVRRSDDGLRYVCSTEDGRRSTGTVPSSMGAEIVASAIFWDLGITDAITDKHRNYPTTVVVPVKKVIASQAEKEDTNSSAQASNKTEVQLGSDGTNEQLYRFEAMRAAIKLDCTDNLELLKNEGDEEIYSVNCSENRGVFFQCNSSGCNELK